MGVLGARKEYAQGATSMPSGTARCRSRTRCDDALEWCTLVCGYACFGARVRIWCWWAEQQVRRFGIV
jgi:hypothetical protein